MPRIKIPDKHLLDGEGDGTEARHSVTISLPPREHAFCARKGSAVRTLREALAEMMEREGDPNPVDLQMRNYIELGALLVADVSVLRRRYAMAKSVQARTQLRREWDALRARVADLTKL